MDINLYPAADPDQPNRMIVLTDAGLTCTGYDTLGDAAEALAALASDLWRAEEEMAGGLADDRTKMERQLDVDECRRSDKHKPVQHRDGKPAWCKACGLTEVGFDPDELGRLGRTREETARLGIKDPRHTADRLTREARLAFGMPDPGSDEEAPDVGGAGKPAGPRFNPQPR